MGHEPRALRALAEAHGLTASDVALASGLPTRTILRLWDAPSWLERVRGSTLQALIAGIPGLGDYVCTAALAVRRSALLEDLADHGLEVEESMFRHVIANGVMAEQDLATALSTAAEVMRGNVRRASTHLARFWTRDQDRALALLYERPRSGGLLVDRNQLIEASITMANRLSTGPGSFWTALAQANLAHQVAKATGDAPAESLRTPRDRRSALTFRSATMGLIIGTNDVETARRYSHAVRRSGALRRVEAWTFPCYTKDMQPTSDLSVPARLLMLRTAREILRELDAYNDAYFDYLVTTGIPEVLCSDPTFGLRGAELMTAIERRASDSLTEPAVTKALLAELMASLS